MNKKILIATALVAAVGISTAGIIANSKQARMRRLFRRAGKTMFTVGTMLRTLSCQTME